MSVKRVIALIFSTLVFVSLFGQEAKREFNIYLDTNSILIGQQIKMNVELKVDVNDSFAFPNFRDSLVNKVEILEFSGIDTTFDESNISQKILTQSLTLTSFDSGFYVVPPISTRLNRDSIYANPFLISVYTYQIDSIQGITDIKEPYVIPLTFMDYLEAYWHYGAGILLAILLGLGIYWFIKSRKKIEKTIVEVKEVIPAHIIALEKLKQLESEKLWQNNQVKEFHVRLSEIVREYIENRYHILALEQTTHEILHHLRLTEISENQKSLLRKFLMLSDLVKYAKEEPLADENTESLKIAFEFVENTIPVQVDPANKKEEESA